MHMSLPLEPSSRTLPTSHLTPLVVTEYQVELLSNKCFVLFVFLFNESMSLKWQLGSKTWCLNSPLSPSVFLL